MASGAPAALVGRLDEARDTRDMREGARLGIEKNPSPGTSASLGVAASRPMPAPAPALDDASCEPDRGRRDDEDGWRSRSISVGQREAGRFV